MVRLANLDGRAVVLVDEDNGHDLAAVSGGRFGPDLPRVYEQWAAVREWLAGRDLGPATVVVRRDLLGPPSPAPRQIFAVGLNYREHAIETGSAIPGEPVVFTKFASCITGPDTTVTLPQDGDTDWEVELVVVIGSTAREVPESLGWGPIAGLTVGQDLSERRSQVAGERPQFSLAKSFPGFGPTGPWLVTADELADPDDMVIGCRVGKETLQNGRTGEHIFPIAKLVSHLSHRVTLLPGDLLFTGTPSGVGRARTPPRYLRAGDTLTSWVTGIGDLRQTFV